MAGPGLVAGEVAVDALPYFDQGYEAPGVREAVRVALREMREAGWGSAAPVGGAKRVAVRFSLRPRRWWRRRRGATDPPRTI